MLKIKLIKTGKHKIEVIKLIRLYTQLSLKKSKELSDNVPSVLVSYLNDISIEQIKKNFEAIGAVIEEIKEETNPPVGAAGVDDSQLYNNPEPTNQISRGFDKKIKLKAKSSNYKPIRKQKPLLKSAIAFAIITALVKSYLNIRFGYLTFYITFIAAAGIAFFLRKKNPIANKSLGITAFAITMLYYLATIITDWIMLYFLYQYIMPFNVIEILINFFTSGNILVLVAAFLSYFLASNKNVFKNISANSEYIKKHENDIMENKYLKDHKKKKKF